MSTCIHCDTDCGADVIQQAEGTCYAPKARKAKEDRLNKKCDACFSTMDFLFHWQEGHQDNQYVHFSYDLYACKCCGTMEKVNLWDDKGSFIMAPDGSFRTTGNVLHIRTATISV